MLATTGDSSISGRIWVDNGNGTWDGGDALYAGVPVRLLGADGMEIARTTSDSKGRYLFAGRASGAYTVIVDVPAGLAAIGVWSTGRMTVNLGEHHSYVASDVLLAPAGATNTLTTSAATQSTTVQSTTGQAVSPGTPPTPVGSKPSYTGSNPSRAAIIGAASLLLGLALVARRGRRRGASVIH